MKASLVICNCRFVNVMTREVLPWQLACQGERILYVGPDASPLMDADSEVVDAGGRYLLPGLISAHDHNEMTMMSMAPFAEAVLPQGTTSVILDPHDTVNVLGPLGLEVLLEEARQLPLHCVFMASPCVPSAPGLENAGASIGLDDLRRMTAQLGVIGVAEAMDFLGILDPASGLQEMLRWIRKEGLLVDGHCPELGGVELNRYIASGPVRTDHESASVSEQLEKLRSGMYVILRRGSIREPMTADKLVDQLVDTSGLLLAVDGCISAEDIITYGHMAWAVRQVIAEGVDPLIAIQMATINVARCYGIDHQAGVLAAGRRANMVLVDDLRAFHVHKVFVNGALVPAKPRFPRYTFPAAALQTLSITPITEQDLALPLETGNPTARVRAIQVGNGSLVTKEMHGEVPIRRGCLQADVQRDLLKLAVLNRYGKQTRCVGFVHGFGFRRGALAGSIGQDSQHLVVIGANDQDMVLAANRVIDLQGGVVLAADNRIVEELALPIAGIMTDISPAELAVKRRQIIQACRELGSQLADPLFSLSLSITLVVIPYLKMSDIGLVDVVSGQFRSLVIE